MARPSFEIHPLTQKVLARLMVMRPRELISWQELSALIDMNAQKEGRHYIDSAKRMARRKGLVIHAKIGRGLYRHDDPGIAEDVTDMRRRKSRRQAQLALSEFHCCDTNALTPEQQRRLTAARAFAGTALHYTDYRFTEASVRGTELNEPPPPPPPIAG